MSKFKDYPIYKKRDGQSFKKISGIYTDSWKNAKKEFANNMTKGNWEFSNDVIWLDKEGGVEVEGWYDFSGGQALYNEETSKYEDNVIDFLLCSKADIDKGFSTWNEDVYTWELRKNN